MPHGEWTGTEVEVSILVAAAVLFGGDVRRARAWFELAKLPSFDGATAAQMVELGRGAAVLKYLESLEGGALD